MSEKTRSNTRSLNQNQRQRRNQQRAKMRRKKLQSQMLRKKRTANQRLQSSSQVTTNGPRPIKNPKTFLNSSQE